MNSSNYMIIICSSFILMGIGVRITTILYQTAYEEISNDKNGIASGIQNSMRQLTACIAIALVATLSSHYTEVAVNHTKAEMISEVMASDVLDQSVRDSFLTAVSQSTGTVSTDKSKEMVHTLLADNEQSILSTLPGNQQAAVKKNFTAQETELDSILNDTSAIKEKESYKVYNKCFLITGIIAMFGLIAVPFNRKKKLS